MSAAGEPLSHPELSPAAPGMRLAARSCVEGSLQLGCLFAAFWTAVVAFGRQPRPEGCELRFLVGLALGAWMAHLGWALQHLDRLPSVSLLLHPAGFCVLFVPLGPLLVVPWRAAASVRDGYLGSSLAALPPALAVARLGCLAAGCCTGLPLTRTFGPVLRHPTPLYEILALLGLSWVLRRLAASWQAPIALGGIGLSRLAVEPLRAASPLGEPLVANEILAMAWLSVAVVLGLHRFRGIRERGLLRGPSGTGRG